jgi:chaperonin cofactor prefoldin
MLDQMDKRFEQVDKRFEQVDKRFEELRMDMNKRFSQLQWTIGIGFTVLAALMGIFNFY